MNIQDFIVDMVEERIVKGNLRWLANFREIHRDHKIGEFTFPLYAKGGLEEKGFLLSRVFSTLVTPKYRVHFLLHFFDQISTQLIRKLIIEAKKRFEGNDWIFFGLAQRGPIDKNLKEAIKKIGDQRVGLVAFSLDSKEKIASDNVLGKALSRQLNLNEAKFEAFDLPSYIKSFVIAFFLGVTLLILLLFLGINLISPLGLIIVAAFSLIAGHRIYKARYHMMLLISDKGFKLGKGKLIKEGKWSDFNDAAVYITPTHETCIRLYSKKQFIDLPLSRIGLSRRDSINAFKQIIKKE